MNRAELVLQLFFVVLHLADPAERFREIQRLNGDAMDLEEFFAVANRIERCWTRADSADSQIFEPPNHFASAGESLQVSAEIRTARADCMEPSQRIANAVLPKVVADGHFAAKAVAPIADGHLAAFIIERMDEHRHIETCPSQGAGHRALIAKVRQHYENAFNFVAMRFEKVSAFLRVS